VRSRWPLPALIRHEELTGRTFRVIYDDSDPNRLLREELCQPGESTVGPADGLMGAGYVEKILARRLPRVPLSN
jgi:hypothetical protein